MNRIIGFPVVWSDLVIYVAILQYRFWQIFFRLWSFPHAVFIQTASASFAASSPKCNSLRDHGHPYKIPDLWPPNSPDFNPVDYKIWSIIQQRVQSTKVQDVKDLMKRLIDAWSEVEVFFYRYSRCDWLSAEASLYLHSDTGGYCEYSLWQKLV